jgi:hypothetical protein
MPTPLIVTVTTGGQPALDAYTVENVITVPGGPDPGLADPELKDAWWEAPPHEAARTGAVASTRGTASEAATSPTIADRQKAGINISKHCPMHDQRATDAPG